MPEHQIIQQQLLRLSKVDFQECLVRFFRPFVSRRPMDWTCIQKSETYFAPLFKFSNFGFQYFDYIFILFENFRIQDKAVTHYFLKKFHRFMVYNCGFPLPDPDEFPFTMPRDIADLRYCKHIEVPKDLNELLTLPVLCCFHRMVMWILRYNAYGCIQDEDLDCYSKLVLSYIRLDPFLNDVDSFRWNKRDDTVSRRRLKLTLMIVESVLKVRIWNFYSSPQALDLIFQAIPDPYVTWQEIFGFLMRRLMPSENQLLYIESFQESCMEYFPQCQREFKPRSLKHLARCKVRKCLGLARTLPHGVWVLGLPRELEDYVLLQKEKDDYVINYIPRLSTEKTYEQELVPENQSLANPTVLLDLQKQVYDNS